MLGVALPRGVPVLLLLLLLLLVVGLLHCGLVNRSNGVTHYSATTRDSEMQSAL
jgi:hypothetical protein